MAHEAITEEHVPSFANAVLYYLLTEMSPFSIIFFVIVSSSMGQDKVK